MLRRSINCFKIIRRKCSHSQAECTNNLRTLEDIPSASKVLVNGKIPSLEAAGSTERLHEFIDERHQKLGCIFRESVGPVNAVFLSNPEHIRAVFSPTVEGKYPMHVLPEAWVLYNHMYNCKRGLFFMNGEDWWQFRRMTNKILMRGNLNWIQKPIETCTSALIDRWRQGLEIGQSQEILNLEGNLYRLSVDVMVATLLGSTYEQSRHLLDDILTEFSQIVHEIFTHSTKLAILPAEVSAKQKVPAWINFVKAADKSLDLANALISNILDRCPPGDGMMTKLLEENVSREDITRIVSDLIIAAGDTTAYTTEWALYLLAKDLQKQDAIRQDILNDGTLVKGVLKEALRLYPVAPFISRILPNTCDIGGYRLPANTVVVVSLMTSGRDANNFCDPLKFLPERWTRDENKTYVGVTNPYASIPFGLGSRSCVGQRVASRQIHVVLSSILKNFELQQIIPNQEVQVMQRMVLVPSEPIRLKITKIV